ncbi:hypothetical protein ABPG75_003322 [Micractinium tetrahymenae]
MAPWQLEEFTRERVERARRLLAEPGEQRGSADLQRFVRSMELVVALHSAFLDENGEARQGLSEREQLQGMATFLCYMSAQLESAGVAYVVDPSCDKALWAAGWAAAEAAAQQLERHQREAGLAPLLTAAAAERLALCLHDYGVSRGAAAASDPGQVRSVRAAAVQSCARVVALEPTNAGFLLKHATALGRMDPSAEAAALSRRALAAAEGSKEHFVLLQAADLLTNLLMTGAEGPRWQLAEARRMLGVVQHVRHWRAGHKAECAALAAARRAGGGSSS